MSTTARFSHPFANTVKAFKTASGKSGRLYSLPALAKQFKPCPADVLPGATLADGRSLLAHSVERARGVFDDVRVVLREGERGEDFGLPGDCRVIVSPDAASGMGHSLAAGARSLLDSPAQAVAIRS